MTRTPTTPTARGLLPLLLSGLLALAGCAPQSADSPPEEQTAPQPQAPSLRILTDLDPARDNELQIFLADRSQSFGGGILEWETLGSGGADNWDVALVGWDSLSTIVPRARDLGPLLDKVYPPHKQDFLPSTEGFKQEEKQVSLPIVFSPDFLYSKQASDWRANLDRTLWDSMIAAGGKIAGPAGSRGDWWRKALAIPDAQWVDLEDHPLENAYSRGEVQAAIADRSWVLADRTKGPEILSLAPLLPDTGVPAWGLHIVLAEGSENIETAETFLKAVVVDLQDSLLNLGGRGFPIRRSIYQSPRMQGALLGAPRAVFDQTLEHLVEPALLAGE